MAAFDQFKQEVEDLKNSENSHNAVLDQLVKEYEQQADKADQLLREQEASELENRSLGK